MQVYKIMYYRGYSIAEAIVCANSTEEAEDTLTAYAKENKDIVGDFKTSKMEELISIVSSPIVINDVELRY